MAATLLSRVIGMLRETIIGAMYGQSIQSDAYNAAFRIPDLLYYLVAGGALASTFVPVFTEYLQKDEESSAWKTYSVVTTVIFVVSTSLVIACEVFAPQLVRLLNPPAPLGQASLDPALHQKTPAQYAEFIRTTIPLVRIVLPAQVFFMMGGLMMGVQNAWGKYLNAALAPSIYNIGIIFGAVVISRMGLGLPGLMWGALLGAFIGNFLLQLIPVVRIGAKFRPSFAIHHPGAKKVWMLLLPILLGVSLPNIDQQVNSYFAELLKIGSQTAINQANRIMLIPIGIFAQAMGIAILPSMSAMAAHRDYEQLRNILNKGLRIITFLTLPCSALMCILAPQIVSVLYQHGKFTLSNVYNTAGPLSMYSLGIIFWSIQAVLTRCFYAIQDSLTPVLSGSAITVIFIGLNWTVVHWTAWGISGLAFMTSLVAGLHTTVLLIVMRRRLSGLNDMFLLKSLTRIVLATIALCIATWASQKIVSMYIPAVSWTPALVQVLICGAAGLGAFTFVVKTLRAPELTSILQSALITRVTSRFK